MQLIYTAEHLHVLWSCAPPAPTLEIGGARSPPGYMLRRLWPLSQILPTIVSLLPPNCLHGLSPGPFLLS